MQKSIEVAIGRPCLVYMVNTQPSVEGVVTAWGKVVGFFTSKNGRVCASREPVGLMLDGVVGNQSGYVQNLISEKVTGYKKCQNQISMF